MEEKFSKCKRVPSLPPCKICGEPASGFHYGLNSCGACKGFFLRSLVRSEPYECTTGGKCKVGPEVQRRKTCQKCRFDKCLRLGMSKNGETSSECTVENISCESGTEETLLDDIRVEEDSNSSMALLSSDDSLQLDLLSSHVSQTDSPHLLELPPTFMTFSIQSGNKSSTSDFPAAEDTSSPGHSQLVSDEEINSTDYTAHDQTANNCSETSDKINNSQLILQNPRCTMFNRKMFKHYLSVPLSSRHILRHHFNTEESFRSINRRCLFTDDLNKAYVERNTCVAVQLPGYSQELSQKSLKDMCRNGVRCDFGFSDVESMSGHMSNNCEEEGTPWSSEFTQTELSEWISYLIDYHYMNIFDNTSFDKDQLKARTDSVYNDHRLQETTFGELKALDRELYFEIYKSTGLDVDGRRTLMSSFLLGIHSEISTVINFFKQIPGFKTIPTSDQIKLVKGCSHEYHILGLYRGWDNSTRCMTFAALGETLTEQDLRKVFPDEALNAHIQMVMTLQKLELTSEQIVLLKAIVATAPDREVLDAEEAVSRIHWKLVNCLLYLLWKQDQCPLLKFGQIMSVLTEMRTYSLLIRASYSNIRSDVEELTGRSYNITTIDYMTNSSDKDQMIYF
ncbi:hypothetical protein Btru_038422 [Bulinus truncatus]|nr:hypothetical protein Btru_038422 [Bulinus truncatus]